MFKKLKTLRYAWNNRHNPECAEDLGSAFWTFALTLSALSMIGVGGYGAWIFFFSGNITESEAVVPQAQTLSREALKNTLELYETRRTNYIYTRDNPPTVSDPSR